MIQSSKEKDYIIIKYDVHLYRSRAFIRTSGTGLVGGTFSDGEATLTFANGGSGTFNIEGETENITYTNNNGELTLTIPGVGNTKMYYNGSNKLYYLDDEARLTFVQTGVTVN